MTNAPGTAWGLDPSVVAGMRREASERRSVASRAPGSRRAQLEALLRRRGPLSTREVADAAGCSLSAAYGTLAKMATKGTAQRVGTRAMPGCGKPVVLWSVDRPLRVG